MCTKLCMKCVLCVIKILPQKLRQHSSGCGLFIFLILAHSSPFFYRYFDIFDTLSLKKIVEIFSFRLILFCKNRRDLYFFLKSSETWDKRRQRCWFLVGQLISKVKYINLKKKKNMAAILSGLKFSFEIEFWTDNGWCDQ